MKMNSQTYMAHKKINPYKLRKNKIRQIGRGLQRRFRGSSIIPVNPNAVKEEGKKQYLQL